MKYIPIVYFKGEPLIDGDAKILINIILNKDKEIPLDSDLVEEEVRNLMLVKILLKRIKAWGLPFMVTDMFFMFSIKTGIVRNPGSAIMLLWMSHCYAMRNQKKLLGIADWCEMFPMGIPTEEEKSNWWEKQKIPTEERNGIGDNLVDIKELWFK